jgi:hypothetical protein
MMDAGRELDALVAEKVMGWSDIDLEDQGDFGVPPEARIPDAYGRTVSWYASPFEQFPHYSTDIAAAWLVVEKVATIDKGEPGGLEVAVLHYPDRCECHIETNSAAFLVVEGAPTAPHAICRAALLAVG